MDYPFFFTWTAQNAAKPLELTGGNGAHFTTSDGATWLDLGALSYQVNAGHGRKRIVEAIKRQADELLEASRIDGAGPFRFFKDTLLPLSVTTIAALFVIQFIYGWNQYLWPLLITTQESMQTIVTGIKKMLTTTDELAEWQLAMATAVLAMLPPVAVVVFMQRLFVRGLVETEK